MAKLEVRGYFGCCRRPSDFLIFAGKSFSIFTALDVLLMARRMGLYALKLRECPAEREKKGSC
jgi:hypothetical protein